MQEARSSFNFSFIPNILSKIVFFVLLFAIHHLATAQEKVKYWIFLTDKQDVFGKNTQVEEGYLSDKATTRRAQRGESRFAAMFALQDAPISHAYEEDLQERGLLLEQRSRWLNAVTARLSEEEVEQITALPYVRSTRAVAHLSTAAVPPITVSPLIPERVSSNCPSGYFGNSCTQLDVVNAIPAIERGINGSGVTLGLIDTHFSTGSTEPFSHPSLTHIRTDNRLRSFRDFTQRDPLQPCPGTNDHGMAVASIAVGYDEGEIIGPGYGATIYAAATECDSYERNIEEDNFVAAVEWMEAEGVDVITSSLGYFGFDLGQQNYTKDDLDGDTGLTTIVMDWAASRGIIPVTSAGNSGRMGRQTIGTPADGDSVIAVGAVWPDGLIVSFSSRGPTADNRTKPDVSAQGILVFLAAGARGYDFSQGTSFSAPMVAGIVTQILQVNPNLGPREIWHALTSTASRADSPDNNFGWGIVDADAAIMHAIILNRSEADFPAPSNLTVHTPYPNPFQDVVHFTIEATQPVSHARLMIIDILGREVGTVYEGPIRAGGTPLQFDGSHLPPGVYAYTLDFDGRTQSGMLTRLGY